MKTIIRVLVLIAVIQGFCLGVSGCSNNGPYGFADYYIEEKGKSVTADSNGNVYVTGFFSGNVDFNPSPGVDEHISTDPSDTFLSKFDTSGAFSWARTWSGNPSYSDLDEKDVVVDDKGNVYVGGVFSGTVDFDPGPGVDEHKKGGVFLSKFDSDGHFIWARTWNAAKASGIAVDSSGDIYIAGSFDNYGPTDFDPGPGVDEHSGWGVFLSKFDAGGNLIWARTWGWDGSAQMAVDGSGYVYLTGIFTGLVDFDPGPGVARYGGSNSPFLCKVDSDGNFVWARTFGGTFKGFNTCVAVDPNSDVFVGGTFSNFNDLNPGSTSDSLASNGNEDIALSKFDSNGDPLWDCTWGGADSNYCLGVTVDNRGNVYATGYFSGTVDFDPGPSSDEHRSRGPGVYLSKLDSSGNFLWARTWGGSGWDKGNGIAYDGRRGIYVTGEFCERVDFNPGVGEDWHTSRSYNDIFLSKFNLDGGFVWARTWGGDNPTSGT